MKKIWIIFVILFFSFLSISQTNIDKPKETKWVLGTTFGYTNVITPFTRNNLQWTLNLRYKVKSYTINFQPGFNYTLETKIPDFRVGIRFQYDFLRW